MDNPSMTNHELLKEIALLENRIRELETLLAERDLAQKALEESKAKYQFLIQNTSDYVACYSLDGKMLYSSDAAYYMIGYKPEEIIGTSGYDRVHEDDRSRLRTELLKAIRSGRDHKADYRAICKDGIYKWVEMSAKVVHNDQTGTDEIVAVVRDINERKQAEIKLRQSEADLAESQRVAALGSWRYDTATDSVTWSEELYRIFDIARDEFGGLYESFLNRVHPEDKARVKEINRRALESGEPFELEYRITTKANELKYLREAGYARRNSSGKVSGLFGTAQDITGIKKTELALRESEKRFRAIADYTPDMENWVGPDGKLIWLNPSGYNLTGYSVEECMGMQDYPMPIIHEVDRERAASAFKSSLEGSSGNNLEFRIRCKDGDIKWAAVSWQPIFDDNGINMGHRASIRDITKRKTTEDALRCSEEQLRVLSENLASGMVYQINSGPAGRQRLFTYLSPAIQDMHGLSVEEVTSNPLLIYDQIEEPYRSRIAQAEAHAFATLSKLDVDLLFRLPSGELRWRRFMSSPHRNEIGDIIWNGIEWDITEQKLTEERQQLLSAITANMSDSIVVTDVNFAITYMNKKAEALFGYSIDEIRGQTPGIFNADPAADEIQRELYATVSQGKDYLGESINRRKDGSTFFCEYKVTPLIGEDGAPYAYIGLQKDVTERKRMEIQLNKSRHELEMKVKERTRELEEANTALRVYLQQQSSDQKRVEEKLQLNVNELVLPYIEKLKLQDMGAQCRTYVEILELNLQNIVSPFMKNLTAVYQKLTSQEIQIAEFIRQGKSSQEIAGVLNLSVKTVNTHRNNIRKKLNLRNKEMNLRSYFLSLS